MKYLYNKIYNVIFKEIDAVDNGISQIKSNISFKYSKYFNYSIVQSITRQVSPHRTSFFNNDEQQHNNFMNAVSFVKGVFEREIKNNIKKWREYEQSQKLVSNAISKMDINTEILIIPMVDDNNKRKTVNPFLCLVITV